MTIAKPICLLARCRDNQWRWNERFRHLHFDALRKLARRLPNIDHIEQFCDCCVATKQRRTIFPAAAKYRVPGLLDLIHGDLCRPVSLATPREWRHFLLLDDDYSRYMWVRLLRSKDEAPTVASPH